MLAVSCTLALALSAPLLSSELKLPLRFSCPTHVHLSVSPLVACRSSFRVLIRGLGNGSPRQLNAGRSVRQAAGRRRDVLFP